MSLTTEQERASHPQANVWVAASAGTGKTHVLTARILRLLLHGVPPEQLLCLTFTKQRRQKWPIACARLWGNGHICPT